LLKNKKFMDLKSSTQSINKIPPQNIEAEMATLGAMLLNEKVISEIIEITDSAFFYKKEHKTIFETIIELYDKRTKIDVLTVAESLRKKNVLEKVGGTAQLTALADFVPSSANAANYARIVKEKGILRALIENSSEIIDLSYKGQEEISALLDRAEKLIFEISDRRVEGSYVHIKDIIKDGIELIESLYHKKSHVTGVPTGFNDFDLKTAGFQKGDLIIVAGRPSMGKSALVTSITGHVAINKKIPVGIFSLEMSKEQLMQRFLCAEAKVEVNRVRTGFLSPSEWPSLTAAAGKLSEAPIYIDDTPAMNIFEIRAKARRLKAHHDIQLILVDYLQLIRGSGRSESRQQEISKISQGLKALAKELSIPLIAVSQLSRAVESREGHRPKLSDLRESGAIEQDADLVVFLFREEYYQPSDENKGIAEAIIAKQRNGPVGTINLAFLKEYMRFADLAK
jgi:replicative DNA helicase